MKQNRPLHSLTALMLLALFAGYLTAIMSFSHVHYVNGAMIVHSHPFQGSHSHTASETLTLHFLTSIDTLEPVATEMLHPVWHLLAQLGEECVVQQAELTSVMPPSLRAPPCI